jgi:hypothetical protein
MVLIIGTAAPGVLACAGGAAADGAGGPRGDEPGRGPGRYRMRSPKPVSFGISGLGGAGGWTKSQNPTLAGIAGLPATGTSAVPETTGASGVRDRSAAVASTPPARATAPMARHPRRRPLVGGAAWARLGRTRPPAGRAPPDGSTPRPPAPAPRSRCASGRSFRCRSARPGGRSPAGAFPRRPAAWRPLEGAPAEGHQARCAARGARWPRWRTWRRPGAGAIPDCGASQLVGAPGRPDAGAGRGPPRRVGAGDARAGG